MSKTEEAYKEIFALMEKHRDIICLNISRLKDKSELHLFGIELVDKFGFNIDPKSITSKHWHKLNENIFIGFFDGKRRRISWPDGGKQPSNETLMLIDYPTGAYIFGKDYPVDFFNKFFNELKSYNPKYIDTTNNCLYFSLDNAAKVFNAYDSILSRYNEKNIILAKARKIAKMKREISEYEKSSQ